MDRTALGFKLAALYNAHIVLFSKGFSEDLGAIDPLFSSSGCVAVLLWGAAYLTLANRYRVIPTLSFVFAVEKGFYALHWMLWMSDHSNAISPLLNADPLTGFFYAIYGAGDFVFMLFFASVAWTWRQNSFTPDALLTVDPKN